MEVTEIIVYVGTIAILLTIFFLLSAKNDTQATYMPESGMKFVVKGKQTLMAIIMRVPVHKLIENPQVPGDITQTRLVRTDDKRYTDRADVSRGPMPVIGDIFGIALVSLLWPTRKLYRWEMTWHELREVNKANSKDDKNHNENEILAIRNTSIVAVRKEIDTLYWSFTYPVDVFESETADNVKVNLIIEVVLNVVYPYTAVFVRRGDSLPAVFNAVRTAVNTFTKKYIYKDPKNPSRKDTLLQAERGPYDDNNKESDFWATLKRINNPAASDSSDDDEALLAKQREIEEKDPKDRTDEEKNWLSIREQGIAWLYGRKIDSARIVEIQIAKSSEHIEKAIDNVAVQTQEAEALSKKGDGELAYYTKQGQGIAAGAAAQLEALQNNPQAFAALQDQLGKTNFRGEALSTGGPGQMHTYNVNGDRRSKPPKKTAQKKPSQKTSEDGQ